MKFHREVKPFIEKYMNRVFRAYDGYGAEIVFPNGVSFSWDFNDEGDITKVTVKTDEYDVIGTTESNFSEVLSIAELLAASELEYKEYRRKIDQQYVSLINKIAY